MNASQTPRTSRIFVALLVVTLPLAVLLLTQWIEQPVAAAAGNPSLPAQPGDISFAPVQTPTNTHTPTPTSTNTPTITPTPSRTPTVTPGPTQTFIDPLEPNNTLGTAASVPVGSATCGSLDYNLSLWPAGDVDYYRFIVKAGRAYIVRATLQSGSNLDPYLRAFNGNGDVIAVNDDAGVGTLDAEVEFIAHADGYYYAEVTNQSIGNPANQLYCFKVTETALPPTATPRPTDDPGGNPDACEGSGLFGNGDFSTACLIGPDQRVTGLNFVPVVAPGPDNDFFRIWVRRGLTYVCGTYDLSPQADTNLIIYDQNGNGIAGNADRDLPAGDLGSEVTWTATYDGYLYVLVGPQNPPNYADSGLHTYQLECSLILATATPTPTSTPLPRPTSPGGGSFPTPTPFIVPTPFPTPTAIDFSAFNPTPTPRPVVQIAPLATPGSDAGAAPTLVLNVNLYYDANRNFQAELNEGIVDVAVALYDATNGQLLAFGYTNDAGFVRFPSIAAVNAVRVVVPYLNYSQVVAAGQQAIVLRVAPLPLPSVIP